MSVDAADTDETGARARRLTSAWTEGAAWLLSALLVAVSVLAAGRTGLAEMALPVSLALLVGWIAWEDMRHLTIPDAATAGLGCLALVDLLSASLFRFDPLGTAGLFILEGAVCGGALLLLRELYFRRQGYDGIGFGDVKLAAAGGCLSGLGGFSAALLMASLAGLAVAVFAAGRQPGRGTADAKIAFGALLAPALWIVWFTETRW